MKPLQNCLEKRWLPSIYKYKYKVKKTQPKIEEDKKEKLSLQPTISIQNPPCFFIRLYTHTRFQAINKKL